MPINTQKLSLTHKHAQAVQRTNSSEERDRHALASDGFVKNKTSEGFVKVPLPAASSSSSSSSSRWRESLTSRDSTHDSPRDRRQVPCDMPQSFQSEREARERHTSTIAASPGVSRPPPPVTATPPHLAGGGGGVPRSPPPEETMPLRVRIRLGELLLQRRDRREGQRGGDLLRVGMWLLRRAGRTREM